MSELLSRARWPLAVIFTIAGLLVPLLAAAIVPPLRSVHSYGDAASLLRDRQALLLFSSISAFPFVILALFTLFHLRPAATSGARAIAVVAAFATMFVLGLWCYAPDTSPGFNFGVIVFPLYAAVSAVTAYLAVWIVTSLRTAKRQP